MGRKKRISYVGRSHDPADLFHRVQIGAEATMHRKDLFVDDCSDWQAVEAIGKCLPQLDVVTALAFVVETVDTIDGSTLVVTSEDKEVFGILDLVGEQ